MYGIDVEQFRNEIVRPTLEFIKLHSLVAENLVLGTALQESRLQYLRQLGKGPALGVCQMEPKTYIDIDINFLTYNPKLKALVEDLSVPWKGADGMIDNLSYAVAMCRVHYQRVKAPLPLLASDALGLAQYWKRWYNTPLGKGTVEEALPHFKEACKWTS